MIAIMIMIGLISLAADGFPAQRIIGGIFPAIVLLAFKKQHQTGFGDIKLIMALGLYYGYLPASIILICAMLLISCYSLLLKRKKGKEIKTVPFAPFIAVFCLLLFIKNILPI
jgi:prepilin signal peptidase PulO-like enzyme (type II secretory pathway)